MLRNPRPKAAGVLEHFREGETNCWLSISGGFLNRTPVVTKDIGVHFFIHSSDSFKLYQRIPGTFRSCYVCLL